MSALSQAQPLTPSGHGITDDLVDHWFQSRGALRALEQSEHPDIVDKFGRAWTWKFGDVYTHDQMAWPRETFETGEYGLPSTDLASNPNYRLCETCRRDWPQDTQRGRR